MENPFTPLEGVDMMPAALGGSLNRPNPIYWEHESNYALRDGHWKLVKERMESNWQLYDMDRDRTENHRLVHLLSGHIGNYANKTSKLQEPGPFGGHDV